MTKQEIETIKANFKEEWTKLEGKQNKSTKSRTSVSQSDSMEPGYEYDELLDNGEVLRGLIAKIPNEAHFPTFILRSAFKSLLASQTPNRDIANIEFLFENDGDNHVLKLKPDASHVDSVSIRYNPISNSLDVNYKVIMINTPPRFSEFEDGTLLKDCANLKLTNISLINIDTILGGAASLLKQGAYPARCNNQIIVVNQTRPDWVVEVAAAEYYTSSNNIRFIINSSYREIPQLLDKEQFWMFGSLQFYLDTDFG